MQFFVSVFWASTEVVFNFGFNLDPDEERAKRLYFSKALMKFLSSLVEGFLIWIFVD